MFINRTDVATLVQAAIAHAQFETIHPFIDGNGRTGHALVHLVLQRRTLVTKTVVPVSTVLLADPDAYFHGLNLYRQGALDEWVEMFARPRRRSAPAPACDSPGSFRAITDDWNTAVHPRARIGRQDSSRRPEPTTSRRYRTCSAALPRRRRRSPPRREPTRRCRRSQLDHIRQAQSGWGATDVLELLERFELTSSVVAKPPHSNRDNTLRVTVLTAVSNSRDRGGSSHG